jgi:hypothetical protein
VPTSPSTSTSKPTTGSITGVWKGQVQEAGRPEPFTMTITFDAKGGVTTDYPQQSCAGKLTKIGTNGAYLFYAEKITKGGFDKTTGKGCLDGTIVLFHVGATLLMSWFGVLDTQSYKHQQC